MNNRFAIHEFAKDKNHPGLRGTPGMVQIGAGPQGKETRIRPEDFSGRNQNSNQATRIQAGA
jgi:hypothetical protein